MYQTKSLPGETTCIYKYKLQLVLGLFATEECIGCTPCDTPAGS